MTRAPSPYHEHKPALRATQRNGDKRHGLDPIRYTPQEKHPSETTLDALSGISAEVLSLTAADTLPTDRKGLSVAGMMSGVKVLSLPITEHKPAYPADAAELDNESSFGDYLRRPALMG